MKKIAETAPTDHIYEDGLTAEELAELVSAPQAWKPVAGTPYEVRNRVKQRLSEKLQKRA